MPRTISMKPNYSMKYWRERQLRPRRRHVFHLLHERAVLRYKDGMPTRRGVVAMADSRRASGTLPTWQSKVSTVTTSPPYIDTTSFEEDQWLRLWFLGGPPHPTYNTVSKDDRHSGSSTYWRFLSEVWRGIAALLAPEARIVCRIGGKGQTVQSLGNGLTLTIRSAFPNARLVSAPFVSAPTQRQTDNFRPGTTGHRFEADFIFEI